MASPPHPPPPIGRLNVDECDAVETLLHNRLC